MNPIDRQPRRFRHFRKTLQAYTAVEVLISMTVFAIGASGVIAMQRTSVQGNYDARTLDVANSIARSWEERLRRDAMLWTTPEANVAGSREQNTRWLKDAAADAAPWTLVTVPAGGTDPTGLSPAFDIFGRDLDVTHVQDAVFCTQVRLQWLSVETRGGGVVPRTIRADVRVFWPRGTGETSPCSAAGLAAGLGPADKPDRYRFVSVSSAIRGNFQ